MKGQLHETLTSTKRIYGFRLTDLLGIAVMIVPFIISFQKFSYSEPLFTVFGRAFFPKDVKFDIRPGYISAIIAVVFYASLILRYNFFKRENLAQGIISTIRFFLNVWVIAALIMTTMPVKYPKGTTTMQVFSSVPTLAFAAVALTWLGMRTIAGYSWILLIFAGWKNILITDKGMNGLGAVFVICFAISLFLQIEDYNDIKDFLQDFKGKAGKYSSTIKAEINEAAQDAAQKAEFAANIIKNKMGVNTTVRRTEVDMKNEKKEDEIQVNLKSLDINKDGVIDEKDFAILSKLKASDESELDKLRNS